MAPILPSVAGGGATRVCNCGARFEVAAPDTARKDKVYCSARCRARTYQKRIAEAKQLSKQGVPIEELPSGWRRTPNKSPDGLKEVKEVKIQRIIDLVGQRHPYRYSEDNLRAMAVTMDGRTRCPKARQ